MFLKNLFNLRGIYYILYYLCVQLVLFYLSYSYYRELGVEIVENKELERVVLFVVFVAIISTNFMILLILSTIIVLLDRIYNKYLNLKNTHVVYKVIPIKQILKVLIIYSVIGVLEAGILNLLKQFLVHYIFMKIINIVFLVCYNILVIKRIDKIFKIDSKQFVLCILCFLSIFSVLLTIIWKLIF